MNRLLHFTPSVRRFENLSNGDFCKY